MNNNTEIKQQQQIRNLIKQKQQLIQFIEDIDKTDHYYEYLKVINKEEKREIL